MKRYLLFLLPLLLLTSCIDEEELDNNPQGNFEALWKIMDEHYCFFTEKGVDWDAVHEKYARQIDNSMTESQTFEVLTNMLSELRDGHVNLYTSFDVGRYWAWHEDYPSNVSDTLLRRYLGTDYRIASGMRYRILDDNVGYVRCSTFENALGDGNLDEMFLYLEPCNGLILDLRGNSGGRLTSAEQLAARFCNEKTLVGYMRHKTGKGHDDFSGLEEQYIKPSKGSALAEACGGADQPRDIQRRQRVCEIHESLSPVHGRGRQHGWRRRSALLLGVAQRLGHTLFGLPHV